MKTFLAFSLAIPLLASCGTKDCRGHVPATVEAFVAAGLEVHCEDSASFEFEGRTVRLTRVAYGEQQDCPSGCFSSQVCAIEDPAYPSPLLFTANWYAAGEAPIGIETECPGTSSASAYGDTYPSCHPSGLAHPLVATPAFRSWADAEEGVGPLRWCVNFVGDTTYWP